MKRVFHAVGFAVLAATLASAPAIAQNDPGELDQLPVQVWEARCVMLSRIFHRLGEQRHGGADRSVAEFRISQWAAQAGDTGSHQKVDYRRAVSAAADFVYGHADMLPVTLAHFGYRSCAFQYRFEKEPSRLQASHVLLLDSARACQKEHPGEKHNRALRDCIAARSVEIGKRVEKARITVRE